MTNSGSGNSRVDTDSSKNLQETISFKEGADTEPSGDENQGKISGHFGRYRIVRTLGSGAMGAVYLARDSQLERDVALKIPKFSKDEDASLIKRFYTEARAAATLSHPNICSVYDVGEIDGTHYITMAYIEGHPLSDFVNPNKPQPGRSVAGIIRKVALAMSEAHAHGIVHRDLKPANIMVDKRNEPIVMDFGLARRSEQGEDSRLTQAGTIMGSPAYMSPEQLDGNPENIGPACDIYSLGVVFYEVITGDLPFRGTGSIASIIGEIFSKEPQNPTELLADLDPQLASICLRAMAKKREDRYESMQALADALTAYLKQGSGSKVANLSPARDAEGPSERRSRPAAADDTDSCVHPDVARGQEQADLVRSLTRQGEYGAAVAILEKMSGIKTPQAVKFADWAKEELPKVQARASAVGSSGGENRSMGPLSQALEEELWEQPVSSEAAGQKLSPLSASQTNSALGKMPLWMWWTMGVACLIAVALVIVVATRGGNGGPDAAGQSSQSLAQAELNGAESDGAESLAASRTTRNKEIHESSSVDSSLAKQNSLLGVEKPDKHNGNATPTPENRTIAKPASVRPEIGSATTNLPPTVPDPEAKNSAKVAGGNSQDRQLPAGETTKTSGPTSPQDQATGATLPTEKPRLPATRPEKPATSPERPEDGPTGRRRPEENRFFTPPRRGQGPFGPGPRPPKKTADELFQELDRNKDNKLTPEEVPQHEQRRLAPADKNRDGFITKKEFIDFDREVRKFNKRQQPGGRKPPR